MGQVVSFSNYKPAARYDDIAWASVIVEEAASSAGPWTTIDTITLDPVDTDPSKPQARNLTIENGGAARDLWYRLTTSDGTGGTGRPSDPIQNLSPIADVDPTLYVQPEQLKQTMGIKDSNVDTTYLDADLLASCKSASRAVEKLTGRGPYYPKDLSNDEVRTFTARGPLTLTLDDLTGVTSIKVDRDNDGVYELALAEGDDYVLQPTNAPADGTPWESFQLRNHRAYLMPIGVPGGVQVTGRFGWLATPPEIVDATTIIAEKVFKRKREAPFSVIGVGLDNLAVRIGSYDAEVQMLLQNFDRRQVVA